MDNKYFRRGWRPRTMLCAVAALAGPSLASAQEVSTEQAKATDSGSQGVLTEIIVTATRRSESVLDVPLSISALDSDSLGKSNIKGVDDLSSIVPGVTFESTTAQYPGLSQIVIRGVFSAAQDGNPTTGIYLDDTSLSEQGNTQFGTSLPAFFDLERVEVLRGPQGTLFGAGAMGGAVRFIHKQPGLDRFSGTATGDIGFTEGGGPTYETGAAFGGPIVQDKLGLRMNVWQRRTGGFIDRYDTVAMRTAEKNANRVETLMGRLAMTWAPTDALKITPSFYWQQMDTPHVGTFHLNISDASEKKFRNGSVYATPMTDRFYIGAVTIDADLGFADLISVSSYLDRRATSVGDIMASFGARAPLPGFPDDGFGNPLGTGFAGDYSDWDQMDNLIDRQTFAQEIRLSSNDPDTRLKWTVGAYYETTDQFFADRWTGTPFDFFPYDGQDINTKQSQLSGFAQIDVRVIQGLTVTAGARYSHLEIEKTVDLYPVYPGSASAEESDDQPFTPKLGLQYQFDSGALLYASASKGFRAGGLNPGLPQTPLCQAEISASYGPDSLRSYEIGTKSRLLDNRMTLEASAFRTEWKDIQTAINLVDACGGSPVANAGSATISGFDAALSFMLSPALRLGLSGAYTDSEYASDVFSEGAAITLDGYSLSPALAPWSVTGSLEYSFDVRGRDAFVRAENVYRARSSGPFMFEVPESPSYNPDLGPDPSYNVLNLRTGVTVDNLQVALYVSNALNAQPVLRWYNLVQDGTFIYGNTITPRTVGLNLNYNF